MYEAEAPKLSVNMEAQGKTMDIGAWLKLVYGHKYGLIGRNGIGKSTLLRYG